MKKFVLAGGPCSGKTTIIDELEKKGFDVIKEVAREVLERRKHFEVTKEEVLTRQKLIAKKQIEQEEVFEKNPPLLDILFSDRCAIDGLAYLKHSLKHIPKEIMDLIESRKYTKIFFLERLPFQNDGLRIEKDEQEAKKIHNKLLSFYKLSGHEIIQVPIMPINERVSFILKNLDSHYSKKVP